MLIRTAGNWFPATTPLWSVAPRRVCHSRRLGPLSKHIPTMEQRADDTLSAHFPLPPKDREYRVASNPSHRIGKFLSSEVLLAAPRIVPDPSRPRTPVRQ